MQQICTGEHPCKSLISTLEITLLHGCSVDVQCTEQLLRGTPLEGLLLNRNDLKKVPKDLRLLC